MDMKAKLEDVMKKQQELAGQIEALDGQANKAQQQYQQSRAILLESIIELRGQEKLIKEVDES